MIAIIADIHGNYPALQAVLKDIEREGCDRIISLGDVAGYYCQVNECIEALRELKADNLLGNHDTYLLTGQCCPRSRSANECLNYQRRVLTEENRHWLKNLPRSLFFDELSFVHGGWEDYVDEYLYDITPAYFAQRPGRYFFSGHTHVQVLADFGEKVYCNPGSVGQPRDGKPGAAYALFEDGKISLRRISYDIDKTASMMKTAGFEAYFYENLYGGTRIGGGVSRLRIGGVD